MSQKADEGSVWVRLDEMLGNDPLSERAARAMLLREGADPEAVEDALRRVDWDSQAEAALLQAAEMNEFNLLPIVAATTLLARGFTKKQTEKAIENGDWHGILDACIAAFDAGPTPPDGLPVSLHQQGFPETQIEEVLAANPRDPEDKCRQIVAWLLTIGTSRRRMQAFLMALGYTKQQARAAIRAEHPDWVQQASLAAEEAVLTATNEVELENVLLRAEFTPAEVDQALLTVMPGSEQAAVRSAHAYLQLEAVSLEGLRDTLESLGYTPDATEYAIAKLDAEDADWTALGGAAIVRRLADDPELTGGREKLERRFSDLGYSKTQIERGLNAAQIDWVQRAEDEFKIKNSTGPMSMDSPRSVIRALEAEGYTPGEARDAARRLFHNQSEAEAAFSEVCFCVWPCGRSFLEQGLRDADFSEDIIADTLDNLFFDWNERALEALEESYRDVLGHKAAPSPRWMREILTGRGFTPEETDYALENFGEDWSEAARLYAKTAAATGDVDVRAELEAAQFPPAAVSAALEELEPDQED